MSRHVEGHILVVDDQQNWREALTSLLRDRYWVQVAGSFDEAKEAILEFSFHVAILDVRLVDRDSLNVDGLELVRLIKEQRPNTKVVILTGYPKSVREEILEEYGVDAFLFKVPVGGRFDSQAFRALTNELVKKYAPRGSA